MCVYIHGTARVTAGQSPLLPSPHHLQHPRSPPLLLPRTQRRNSWFSWGSKKGSGGAASTAKPLSDELSKREREQKLLQRLSDNTQGPTIFDEEIKETKRRAQSEARGGGGGGRGGADGPNSAMLGLSRVREHMERALDPDPRWRIRYQKRKVAQMVREQTAAATGSLAPEAAARRRHEDRVRRIRLSERQATSQSSPLATSTKKLVHLSHQIVGKTVDEAIEQMRFSKKKMAREVRYQLEEARDTAIAAQGMGLGPADRAPPAAPRKIQDKAGRWFEVSDPTRLYVDESWVGTGPYRGARVQYHARSRMSLMWRPTARESSPPLPAAAGAVIVAVAVAVVGN